MEKSIYNGREYMTSTCYDWVSSVMKEKGIDFTYKELPIDFLSHPMNRYLVGIYEYESVEEPRKTVYAVAIEKGDIEGAISYLFHSYDKISVDEAIKIEEAFHKEEIETHRMYEDGTFGGYEDVQ